MLRINRRAITIVVGLAMLLGALASGAWLLFIKAPATCETQGTWDEAMMCAGINTSIKVVMPYILGFFCLVVAATVLISLARTIHAANNRVQVEVDSDEQQTE